MVKAKLYVLDLGWLECDEGWMVALPRPGTYPDNKEPTAQWIKIPVYGVFLDHPEGTILFDTGSNYKAMEGYWPAGLCAVFPFFYREDQTFDAQLEKIGVTPDDIDYVALSHLHLDHAGNLYRFANKKAKIIVQREEAARAFYVTNVTPAAAGAYVKADFTMEGLNWMPIEGDFPFLEDVEFLTLPGHTASTMGMKVTLKSSGTWVFCQDACYTAKNFGPPATLSGIIDDSKAYFNSVRRLHDIKKKEDAEIVFGHEMAQFETLKKAPEFYD